MDNELKSKINTQLLGMTEEQLPRVSLEGTEIVSRQFLLHIKEAVLTIRPDGVMFNNACIAKMEGVYYVFFHVDRRNHRIIIRGGEENKRDVQKFCNVKADGKRVSRKITGRPMATRLYAMMGWSRGYYYKICGTPALQLEKEDELLMVFDLDEFERYPLTSKGRKSAGVEDDELDRAELEQLVKEEAAREEEKSKDDEEPSDKKPKRKRRKPEYSDNLAGESFGTLAQNHVSRPEIKRVDLAQMSLSDFIEVESNPSAPDTSQTPDKR